MKFLDLLSASLFKQRNTLAEQLQRQQERVGWGHRRLARFKTVKGKRYQLHATRGWKRA